MPHLILVGAGHAHLAVLARLAQRPCPPDWQISLISPSLQVLYSGMVPGWMAGHYRLEDCQLQLQGLVQQAGVHHLARNMVLMNAQAQTLLDDHGQTWSYDLLSLDVGSLADTSALQALGPRLLAVRPLTAWVQHWPACLAMAEQLNRPLRLAVVGGGAAGLELVLAAEHALRQRGRPAQMLWVTGTAGPLPGHHASVQARARRCLQQRGIAVLEQRVQGHAEGLIWQDVHTQTHGFLAQDRVLAAPGAKPAPCLADSGLALDASGFVQVHAHHQSCSHPQVFAAGDTCARNSPGFARSGVHAVHVGPVLAHNLELMMHGFNASTPAQQRAWRCYHPRRHSLYLLATGPKQAIASWGPWSAQGPWVWHWKNWLDRRFVQRYSLLTAATAQAIAQDGS